MYTTRGLVKHSGQWDDVDLGMRPSKDKKKGPLRFRPS